MSGILVVLHSALMSTETNNAEGETQILQITGFNVHGLSSTKDYMKVLMNECDIIGISEHFLYEHELYKLQEIDPSFECVSKSSKNLTAASYGHHIGHGGIAILWKKTLQGITPVNIDNDRICGIQLTTKNKQLLTILSVYLPQAGCKSISYDTVLDDLFETVQQTQDKGPLIIIDGQCCKQYIAYV